MSDQAQTDRQNVFRVVFVGLCFMLLFTAFQTAQNLISSVYKLLHFTNLGQICLFSIYGALGIGNVFASHFKRKMSHKTGMLFGAFFYTLFIACGTVATYCGTHEESSDAFYCQTSFIYTINVISSILLGMSGSILWLSQSDYVNQCTEERTKGFLNGIFWSLMQLCQIIGSILATFVLGNTDSFKFYILLLAFGVVALVMFTFLPALDEKKSVLTASEKPVEELGESIKKFFAAFFQKESYFISIVTFLSGIIIASYAAFLPTLIARTIDTKDDSNVYKLTGYCLICLAFGEVLAGVTVGKLADKFNKIKLLNITILVVESALLISFLAYFVENYGLVLIGWFVWGLVDNTINTLATATIGSYFNGSLELFAIYRFMQGLGVVVGSVLTIVIPTESMINFFYISGAIIVGLHVLFNIVKIDRKPEASSPTLLSTE